MSLLFTPFTFNAPSGPLTLPNRIVVAPMCQYSADNGQATDWHLTHWTNLLNSGAGLFTIEATAVSAVGRISPGCLGLWDDATQAALGDKLERARRLAPVMPVCIQISHAGRKASSACPWDGGMLITPADGGWQPVAPSALPHLPQESAPTELSLADIAQIKADFVNTARRSQALGIEAVELHAAHGYLLHQFLSPISNQRTDQYGGSFENRIRFPMEVFKAVREAFGGTLGMRISGTDWVDGGWTVEETAELAIQIKQAGAQFVHISSALTTIAVGLITEPAQAEAVLQRGDADLVALARSFMYKPRWGWEAAVALDGTVDSQHQYWRSLPREAKNIFNNAKIGMR